MASNTENLGLLKKNPSTDGADTFNIQTMLNDNWDKLDANAGTVAQTLANILKPTTPPLIGLPPSTTPDGMFRAFGNTGELHVWRKTVTTVQEIPAGYTLGDVKTKKAISATGSGQAYIGFYMGYSDSLAVDDNGGISLNPDNDYGEVTANSNFTYISSVIAGKFILIRSYQRPDGNAYSSLAGKIFYVPADASISMTQESNYLYIRLSKCQDVTGYPLTPAGTTTTYPVSTNPNAYQEGDDAKEAGYTLGEVETGKFALGVGASGTENQYKIANSITVDDSGSVSLVNPTYMSLNGSSSSSAASNTKSVVGKFLIMTTEGNVGDFPADTVWFIPTDANTGNSYNEGDDIYNCKNYVTKRQRVTGYAAIPAGTTIEYQGKLGDKARVQVVSYVGTGTYGESNPVNITANFRMKFLAIYDMNQNANPPGTTDAPHAFIVEKMETTYRNYWGYALVGGSYGKRSVDGKTVSFYGTSSGAQANVSGYWYLAIAIG